ncbi:P-loop NTPase fold protein [Terracoccus sp. 273MFTsu3.1]|uniref:P-loop NTPase fold protein n=1 Tax=Terracoccus sp. 273MFTsu3.1 TaxID=1172188 RepID=UPI0018C96C70|nr:P-loop NTPase fold protein [Terracoccus sp. 273MFTsu3.1]
MASPPDETESLRRRAEMGSPTAMRELGLMARASGDLDLAESWLRRAALENNMDAARELAQVLMQKGEESAAVVPLREAADRGDPDALRELGLLLERIGDVDAAVEALQRAADMGDRDAIRDLGLLQERRGNMLEARDRFRQGARLGDPFAKEDLARIDQTTSTLGSGGLEADQNPKLGSQGARIRSLRSSNDSSRGLVVAGLVADSANSTDLIGIGPDVRAMSALLSSRRLEPPIAVGLYGEWGSGKTFFMKHLQAEIHSLSEQDVTSSTFCRNVAHVWFSAWHYAEGNLWASLLDHVFTCLNGTKPAYQKALDEAIGQLTGAQQMSADAAARLKLAEQSVAVAKDAVAAASTRRRKALTDAHRLGKRDLWAAVEVTAADTELKKDLSGAATTLGVPPMLDSAKELWETAGMITTLARRARVLATAGGRFKSPLAFGLYAAAIVGLTTFALSLVLRFWDEWAGSAALVIGQVTAVFSAAAALISRQSTLLRRLLRPALRVQHELEQRLKEVENRFAEEMAILQDEVRLAEADYTQRQTALVEAEVAEAQAKLKHDDMTGVRLLHRYLKERAESADYQNYLGVVALAHRDLRELEELIKNTLSGNDHEDGKLDRIILYIDDLDRCDPERVADVLDAVHLLLALPLFVVVVGVNPRWLEQSLRERHPVLLADRSASTTAADYLEKIFQLTYSLPPMGIEGSADLLAGLANSSNGPASSSAEGSDTSFPISRRKANAPRRTGGPIGAGIAEQLALRRLTTALFLNPDEIAALRVVAPLVSHSPRRAQRFLNLYLVLRARYLAAEIEEENAEDVHAGLGLLLAAALAIGVPSALQELLANRASEPSNAADIIRSMERHVDKESEEGERWSNFVRQDVAAFGYVSATDLLNCLDGVYPYLPLGFQARLRPEDSL